MNAENLKKLENEIIYLTEMYERGEPVASDSYFDDRIILLKSLAPNSEVLNKISFDFGEILHRYPMLSTEKYHHLYEVDSNIKSDVRYNVSVKADGIAVGLKYYKDVELNKYVFIQALTRGDGIKGFDITESIGQMENLIKEFDCDLIGLTDEFIELRGEAIISKEQFNIINSNIEDKFTSARNLVAGTLNHKASNTSLANKRGIDILIYSVISDSIFVDEYKLNISLSNLLFDIEHIGFMVIDNTNCVGTKVKDTIKYFVDNRNDQKYEIDGVVVRIDDYNEFYDEGKTRTFYKGMFAYKFKSNSKVGKLQKVTWQVGRTGAITPVAHINPPVDIKGASISKVTLHNLSIYKRLALRNGDELLISRAGDVIPHILKNNTKHDSYSSKLIPRHCPSCDSELIVMSNDNSEHLMCNNIYCEAKLKNRIQYFFKVLDVKDIGSSKIDAMIEHGVDSIKSIYKLTNAQFKKYISTPTNRISERNAVKLYNNIHSKKKILLSTFITAFGFKGISDATAEKIFDKYKTLDSLLNIKTSNELKEIDGIGDKLALVFFDELITYRYNIIELSQEFDFVGVVNTKYQQNDKITGKTFIISGKLSKGKSFYYNLIEKQGGVIISTVNKNTDYLISDGKQSTKYKKAISIGVTIITERQLNNYLQG